MNESLMTVWSCALLTKVGSTGPFRDSCRIAWTSASMVASADAMSDEGTGLADAVDAGDGDGDGGADVAAGVVVTVGLPQPPAVRQAASSTPSRRALRPLSIPQDIGGLSHQFGAPPFCGPNGPSPSGIVSLS